MAWAAIALCAASVALAAVDMKQVVLRVGPLEVPMETFSKDFHALAEPDTSSLTPDRAGVERFRKGYTETLLLHAWAMADSGLFTPQEAFMAELTTDQIYQEALRDALLPQYLKMDDTVLRTVYDRARTDLHLAVIRTPTYPQMDSARTALASGLRFEEVARRWSKDPMTAINGGDLGWMQATSFPLEHQQALWSLADGATSEILNERQFHALYRVVGRRPNVNLGPLDSKKKEELRHAILQNELPRVAQEIREDLMASWEFRVDMQTSEWLRAFLHRETATARRTFDPKLDRPFAVLGQEAEAPFWSEAPLQGADADRPIASMRGDTLTALGVIDELIFQPTLVWPRFETVNDVVKLCESALYYRIQVNEAKRLGLDKNPEVQRTLADRQRWKYWRAFRRVRLLPPLEPTEAELRAVYEARYKGKSLPERRRFVLVNTPAEDQAIAAAKMLREGYVPSSIVQSLASAGEQFQVTPDTTMGWVVYGQVPSIDPVLFKLDEGEVSDPIPDGPRYSVLRVERVSPSHALTFEDVAGGIRSEFLTQRERTATAELLAKARARFKVWYDAKALEKMPIEASRFHTRATGARP